MGKKAPAPSQSFAQIDYDALPESVQRKYFSDLERLQIQQQQQQQQQQTAHDLDYDPASLSASPVSSATQFRLNLMHRRRRDRKEVTQAEALFFLSLPEKVRKQQFSREEQVILLSHCDQVFPNGSPSNAEITDELARQRLRDFEFDFPKQSHSTTRLDQGDHRPRALSSNSSWTPRRSSFTTSRSSDWGSEVGLFFFDPMGSAGSRMPSTPYRRTMSMSDPSSPHSATSPLLGHSGRSFECFKHPPQRQRAYTTQFPGRSCSSSPSSTTLADPEAAHYQDPEARKKLRTYLASPQKFDEAVQFGFPASTETEVVQPHYQLPPIATHSRKFSRDMHTFLKDGRLSFLDKDNDNEGLESDGESAVDVESPATPSSTGQSFRLHSRQMSSMDSTGVHSTHSSTASQSNREMTLRMTLTRPDLRADDEQLYGWQAPQTQGTLAKEDPLALEELVLSDDQTGTSGPFYVKPKPRGGLVTRLLKRASLRSQPRP